MKTLLALVFALTVVWATDSSAQSQVYGKTEALRPAPIAPRYNGPFNERPSTLKLSKQNPLAGITEKISVSRTPLADSQIIELPTPIALFLIDDNGDTIPDVSTGGTQMWRTAYGARFTTTMDNPQLDSVRVWFYVDSMENVQGNAIEVGAVKQRWVTGTDGEDRPFPDLGVDGGLLGVNGADSYQTNHKDINRSVLASSIGSGALVSRKVTFNPALALPEPDFVVYVNSRAYISGSSQNGDLVIVTNAIRVPADSININENSDYDNQIDYETNRSYNINLDEELAFYSTSFAILDGRDENNVGEVYFPNLFMEAYVRNPTGAVEDIKLEGNALAQNYPNPFNPSTNIAYSVKESGQASLKVYNALGNEVATLVDGYTTAGKHEVMFDASELPTGTYYYTLKSGSFTSTKRMVLAK